LPERLSNKRGLVAPRLGWSAVAAVALTAVLSACGSSSPPLPPLQPNRLGPEAMFTPANELMISPEQTKQTLDELKKLGIDTIHVYMHWADLAPDPTSRTKPSFDATDPAAYPAASWAPYDTIVRDVKTEGMGLILDLVPPPPDWASAPGAPHPAKQPEWRPSASEYGQFVDAVGTRYSGHYVPPGGSAPLPRVSQWSIWNEPNLGIELAPEVENHTQIEVSGALYRGLVDSAWKALHATGHGQDTILIGELAPAGVSSGVGLFNNMPPLRFLRALYCVDSSYRLLKGTAAQERGCPTTSAASKQFPDQNPGLFHATGVADHPYTFPGLPPNQAPPDEPDYAEMAELPKLERTLDTLQRVYGSDTQFPIYSTEYGYQTTPPAPGAGTVSPTTAAEYLNWSEYITWKDPRIRSYDQYLLADPPSGVFATGLEYANGTQKPGYPAFRMPIFMPVTATQKGKPLEVWGCVRPARYAQLATHRTQQARIQFQPASGGAYKTVSTVTITDRYGYFDVLQKFPGSGTVRTAWSYPHGPEVFSRAVKITLR
jgi:hypothetical protein